MRRKKFSASSFEINFGLTPILLIIVGIQICKRSSIFCDFTITVANGHQYKVIVMATSMFNVHQDDPRYERSIVEDVNKIMEFAESNHHMSTIWNTPELSIARN